jgi:hypothetical protein
VLTHDLQLAGMCHHDGQIRAGHEAVTDGLHDAVSAGIAVQCVVCGIPLYVWAMPIGAMHDVATRGVSTSSQWPAPLIL